MFVKHLCHDYYKTGSSILPVVHPVSLRPSLFAWPSGHLHQILSNRFCGRGFWTSGKAGVPSFRKTRRAGLDSATGGQDSTESSSTCLVSWGNIFLIITIISFFLVTIFLKILLVNIHILLKAYECSQQIYQFYLFLLFNVITYILLTNIDCQKISWLVFLVNVVSSLLSLLIYE